MTIVKWLLFILFAPCLIGCSYSRTASVPSSQPNPPDAHLIITKNSFVWWPFGHNIGEIVTSNDLKLVDHTGKTRIQFRVGSDISYAFAFSDEAVLFIKNDHSVGYNSKNLTIDPVGILPSKGIIFDESGEVLLVSKVGRPFFLSKQGGTLPVEGSIAIMTFGMHPIGSICLSRASITSMLTK